jgi:voltage-dependent calcium channel alpha-2/delta-3
MSWPKENLGEDPDLFDSRMRPWYTGAANSPKSIIILQDTSGSMTGRRREIAKHVVYTLLDTLTENDYVNIFNISVNATPIVPCFYDKLVQVRALHLVGGRFKFRSASLCTAAAPSAPYLHMYMP